MTCNMMTGIFSQITFEKQKINFMVEIKSFSIEPGFRKNKKKEKEKILSRNLQ